MARCPSAANPPTAKPQNSTGSTATAAGLLALALLGIGVTLLLIPGPRTPKAYFVVVGNGTSFATANLKTVGLSANTRSQVKQTVEALVNI